MTRKGGVPTKEKRRRFTGLRLLIGLVLLGGVGAGFLYSQQNWIEREAITVTSERLPAAFEGLRVVQISDLHGKEFGEGNEALLAAVAAEKPDLIAITGDVIDDRVQLERLPALARGLAAIAPTYYVTGNHEWAARAAAEVKQVLRAHGVTPLSNECVRIERGGESITLAGVDDRNGPAGQKTPKAVLDEARACSPGGYTLLLAHRNDERTAYNAAAPDLVLCGHGHGGIVRLPFLGGLVGNRREFFPGFTEGLYQLEATQMVVSRGLGNNTLPVRSLRLFNRPHLLTVILRSGAEK